MAWEKTLFRNLVLSIIIVCIYAGLSIGQVQENPGRKRTKIIIWHRNTSRWDKAIKQKI